MNINLIKVGQNFDFDFNEIKKKSSRSKIFRINEIQLIPNPPYSTAGAITINDLDFIRSNDQEKLCIAIIDRPFVDNYFSHSISENNVIVISLQDLKSVTVLDGISPVKFLLRFIYAYATIYKAYGNRIPSNLEVATDRLMQANTRGCLFDFCKNKSDSIKFFKQPMLSVDAEVVLNNKILPVGFIKTLKKELVLLKPGKVSLVKSWVSQNVIVSTILTFVIGVISNVISNYLSGILKL